MPFEYKNIPKWTEEDERVIINIQNNGMWLFKYFLIGMAFGIGLFILLKIIDWWAVSHLIFGVVGLG